MPRVSGPLFSLDASGALDDTIVYSKWKGRPYVRKWASPSNPKSPGQLGIRAMFRALSKAWDALTAPEQASYEELAESLNVSPFNVFMKFNMELWREYNAPSKDIARAQAHTGTTVATLVTTGGIHNVAISGTLTTATNQWLLAILRSSAEITVPSWDKVVEIVEISGTAFNLVDSPLVAGTYHDRAVDMTDDGVFGTCKADQTAVVTN